MKSKNFLIPDGIEYYLGEDAVKFDKLKLDGIDITPLGHFTENKKRILVSKNGQEINMESEGWNHF